MKKEKVCLVVLVAIAMTIQMCYAQHDVKGSTQCRVAKDESTVQFRGINKTGAEIHAFKIEIELKSQVSIKAVEVSGYGDWDVDDDGDGKSQEANETDNIDSSLDKITRVDRLGKGNENKPENTRGIAIPENGEFLIIITFSRKVNRSCTLWIYPYTQFKNGTTRWQQLLCIGCDPPIYGNIIAFPTPEHFISTDLNSDNDTYDTILRYQNLQTGQIINTGLIVSGAHCAIDIFENIIAFVGQGSQICYYNINTGTVSETGAIGSRLSIYENIIVFSSKGRVHYFDLSTQELVNTEVIGYSPVVYQNVIVFHSPPPKHTIWFYDLYTGEPVDTGAIGKNPTIYENIIAFETLEFSIAEDLNGDGDLHDLVIRYYDLETQTITNTGAVGYYPSLHGSRLAFTTPEYDFDQDQNGDGKTLGNIIRYYDLKTGQVVNTRKLGTEPDIYEDTIAYYLWEYWIGQDLNYDGDQSDPIVDSYQIGVANMAIAGRDVILLWSFC